MAHPLEAATAAIMQSEQLQKNEIARLRADLREAEHECAALRGRLDGIEKELTDAKSKADHYLRWNVEIIKQMTNISMFVEDSLNNARLEVAKANGSAEGSGAERAKLSASAGLAAVSAATFMHERESDFGGGR